MPHFLTLLLSSLLIIIQLHVHVHVHARFVVEKSSVSVLSPTSLKSKHDAAIANFGIPDYGGFIVGSLFYPQTGAFGCLPFQGDKPFKSNTSRPTILLLDRGGNLFLFLFLFPILQSINHLMLCYAMQYRLFNFHHICSQNTKSTHFALRLFFTSLSQYPLHLHPYIILCFFTLYIILFLFSFSQGLLLCL